MNNASVTPRWRGWLTCQSRRQCLLKIVVVLLIALLATPAGREWAIFLGMGGQWVAPKGWPFGEPWRDWDKPTDPRELAAFEYAHGLKLPDRLPKPVPFGFTRHLLSNRQTTAVAYFDHLCATEAGEYIFKKVEKVEGLYQMRAMPRRSDKVLRDRYGFEDPADWSQGEADGSPFLFLGGPGNGFRYFESNTAPQAIANQWTVEKWAVGAWSEPRTVPFWRYHQFDYTNGKGQVLPVADLESRYAYTWRGIHRERDREFGIAGGELVVLDRSSGEILGVRRSFAIAKQYRTHLDWEFASFCPGSLRPIRHIRAINKLYYPFSFVFQVIRPADFDPIVAVQPKS